MSAVNDRPDAPQVIRAVDAAIVKPAIIRLNADEIWLHNNGYHKYRECVAEFRRDLESSFSRLVDNLTEADR